MPLNNSSKNFMTIFKPLKKRIDESEKQRLAKRYTSLEQLLSALSEKEIPQDIIVQINEQIDILNSFTEKNALLIRKIDGVKLKIIRWVEKKLKLVPRKHYQNQWTALGMTVFGIPLGVIFGFALGNMAFLGIGLSMGIPFGLGIGISMDKKAEEEGRQLNYPNK